MITYNHEPFIEAAVNSALMQQTDFDVEIVIGDDCSSDHTRELLTGLQRSHPERIRLFLRDENIGMLRNFAETLTACRGEYVALLEGDDYWTDPLKLQKQADFLDAHPICATCHHNALRVVEGEGDTSVLCHPRRLSRWQSLDDLMSQNPIVTCTAMFRQGLFGEFPDWFFQSRMGDWPLHILNAQHGRIGYLDEVMAAYRIHSGSKWSQQARLDDLEGIVASLEVIQPHLPVPQQSLLAHALEGYHEEIVQLLLEKGRPHEAEQHATRHLRSFTGYHRLRHFYAGLTCEERGRSWAANGHFLAALVHGWRRTPVRARGIWLALWRNSCPRTYRWGRDIWRSQRSRRPE